MTDFPLRSRRRHSWAGAFWAGFLLGCLYFAVVVAVAKLAWTLGLGGSL